MKKIFLFAVTMLMAFAVQASILDDVRIYINPGHGSWGPNDRPMATIPYPMLDETGRPDTCGFYESNTNLWKSLAMAQKLIDLGMNSDNIMHSRVKNGPYPYVSGAEDQYLYNRNLSEICEEVDANNMDYFISIHSNATTDGSTANYPLLLYRGNDGGDDYAEGSYDMAYEMWDYLNVNGIDVKSHYQTAGTTNIRGDISFFGSSSDRVSSDGTVYTGYYGVLKHGTPGYISEGYFHTYQPARHRGLNQDYCAQEGVRYARGVIAYYEDTADTKGYIMGTIKDKYEKMSDSYFTYAVGSIDQYLPINGATVNLYKGGELIDTYTCDQNYNGVFVFSNLEPADDYSLDYSCEGYNATEDEYKETFSVYANETTFPIAYLVSETYVEPEAPEFVYENYPNPEQDGDIVAGDKYNMTEVIASAVASDLDGKTIRRSILRNGELYVLAVDDEAAPYLYVIDPETGATTKTLSTEGTQGEYYALSDIAFTADDVLIGCNMEECQFYPEGTFRIYKWDDLDADPIEWFTSQKSGNYYNANVGVSMAVTGDSQNCTVITSAKTISGTTMRMLFTDVVDGVKSTEYRNQDTPYTTGAWGEDYSFVVSPRADNNIIIDGSGTAPVEYTINPSDASPMTYVGELSAELLSVGGNGATYFKYGGSALMVAPEVDADGNVIDVKLFNITNGLDVATEIAIEGIDVADEVAVYSMAAAVVDNADIDIYLQKDSKVSKYSTSGIEQPTSLGVAAYNLAVTSSDDVYTFTFKASDSATAYKLIVSDADGVSTTIATGDVFMGDNSVAVNKSDLPYADELTWSVEVTNDKVTRVTKLNSDDAQYQYTRLGGIAVDNNPESDKFGQFYVTSYYDGFYAYDIYWNRINEEVVDSDYPFNALFRMDVAADGNVYAAEWNDANAGVYQFDPEEMTTKNIFEVNPNKASSGLYTTADGVQIAGSSTSVSIVGEGENMLLYTFDEDYTASDLGKGNNVLVYEMGTATDIDFAPVKAYAVASKMLNTNCHIIANEDGGVWVSQTRYAPNNTSDIPSFIYVDADGTELYNSGTSIATELTGTYGSGFSISPDGKTFVVNNSSEFIFFDITWSEGVPTLTYKYSYSHDLGASVYQIDFDYAGNMYAAGTNVGIYAIPSDENVVMTTAKTTIAGQVMEIVAPTEAAIVDNGDETVTLTWTAPATDLAVTYNLYIGEELVVSELVYEEGDELSYVFDKSENDDTIYAVSATYPNGEESDKATTTISAVESVEVVKIAIYPNPTTGVVNIAAGEEVVSVDVYSVTGALVGKFTTSSIDISDLAAGTYFIKVNDNAPVRVIKK
ncbi:MAG: T9SS type A sorting domain-containing protein [Bacteroidales bacterium]